MAHIGDPPRPWATSSPYEKKEAPSGPLSFSLCRHFLRGEKNGGGGMGKDAADATRGSRSCEKQSPSSALTRLLFLPFFGGKERGTWGWRPPHNTAIHEEAHAGHATPLSMTCCRRRAPPPKKKKKRSPSPPQGGPGEASGRRPRWCPRVQWTKEEEEEGESEWPFALHSTLPRADTHTCAMGRSGRPTPTNASGAPLPPRRLPRRKRRGHRRRWRGEDESYLDACSVLVDGLSPVWRWRRG